MKDYIQKIKEMQERECRICPRCGEIRMKRPIHTNALSRVADGCYICDRCGMDEALQNVGGKPDPVESWNIIKLFDLGL